jgi:hypothetical protein
MYTIAKAKLYTEIDVGELIKNARIGRFVSKMLLKKRHLNLIQYFKCYNSERLWFDSFKKQYTTDFTLSKLNFEDAPDEKVF